MIELLKTRRSIRKYENRPVEKEKIENLLKAALLAPSSRSIRPWEFIAVTDKELIEKLSHCKEYGSQFLKGAPLAIVVIANTEKSDVWIEDASIAGALIHLTAHSMGIGSCWIQVRERMRSDKSKAEDYVKKVLNIPEVYSVECIIAAGYADEAKKPYEDSDLMYNKIHFNQFDIEANTSK
jgi:nitroreductase